MEGIFCQSFKLQSRINKMQWVLHLPVLDHFFTITAGIWLCNKSLKDKQNKRKKIYQ